MHLERKYTYFSFNIIFGGVTGIVLSSGIIGIIVYKVLNICTTNKIYTYNQFCKYLLYRGELLNNIVNIFLLLNFYIMIAGFSSLLNQEANINKFIGSIIIIVLNYIVSLKSVKGLEKVSNFVIPAFSIFVVVLMIKNENYSNIFQSSIFIENFITKKNTFSWLIKSILYASYNSIILIPIVVILSQKLENFNTEKTKSEIVNFMKLNQKKYSLIISFSIFLIIFILSISIINLLLLGNENIYSQEMPVISIVKQYGTIYKYIYILLIAISIFTTATSSGISFINNIRSKNARPTKLLLLISITALPVSQLSFGNLVNYLYPVLGFIGLIENFYIIKRRK